MNRKIDNFFWKLKMFFKLEGWRAEGYDYWRKEIWVRDPDELYCCNGHQCGCRGCTVRAMFEFYGEAR